MALSDVQVYIGDGATRDYTILGEIPSKSHLRVWLGDDLVSSDSWDLLGNTVLFEDAPTQGDVISFMVSTTGADFPQSPSDLSAVAANLDLIKNVSDKLGDYQNTEFIVNGLPPQASEGDIAMNVEDGKIYQYQSNVWTVIAEGEGTYSYPNPVDVFDSSFPTSDLYKGKVVYLTSTNSLYIYNDGWTVLNATGKDGTSITWKGSYPSSSYLVDVQEGWTYRNTTDGVSYIYKNNAWVVFSKDGINGKNGSNGTNGINGYNPVKGVDYFDGDRGVDGASVFTGYIFKSVPIGTVASTTAVPTISVFDGYNITVNNGWTDDPYVEDVKTHFIITSLGKFYQEKDSSGKLTDNWVLTAWSTPQKYTLEYGVDFINGANGSYTSFIYKLSATTPAQPIGGNFQGSTATETFPSGWADNPTATDADTEWVSKAVYEYNGVAWVNTSGWSTPSVRYKPGKAGEDGIEGQRGSSIITYDAGASSFNSSTATSYFTSTYGTPINGDQLVWSTTASGGTAIWTYNGSTWSNNTTWTVDGDAVIDGSLYANKLATTALYGKTCFFDDTSNNLSYNGGTLGLFQTNTQFNAIAGTTVVAGGHGVYGYNSNVSVGAGVRGDGNYGVYGNSNNAGGYWGLITDDKCYAGEGFSSPVTTISFTGGHTCFANTEVKIGDIVETISAELITVDQSYTNVASTIEAMSAKVFGVVSKVSDDVEINLRDYKELLEYPDTHGVVKGTYKDEYKPFIQALHDGGYKDVVANAIGEGGINVCDSNGDILNGDYICSSNVAGKGAKQDDDILHSYTVAKALGSVVWDNEVIGEAGCFEQDGVKCKMIACTYHCG